MGMKKGGMRPPDPTVERRPGETFGEKVTNKTQSCSEDRILADLKNVQHANHSGREGPKLRGCQNDATGTDVACGLHRQSLNRSRSQEYLSLNQKTGIQAQTQQQQLDIEYHKRRPLPLSHTSQLENHRTDSLKDLIRSSASLKSYQALEKTQFAPRGMLPRSSSSGGCTIIDEPLSVPTVNLTGVFLAACILIGASLLLDELYDYYFGWPTSPAGPDFLGENDLSLEDHHVPNSIGLAAAVLLVIIVWSIGAYVKSQLH